ncbi:MAG TPA: carboxy terminal-processing peptidase [Gammaproteobacteria bacterium]|nr:carboxy terminal-processing peptidase [Gammaproteobacteria bacterium]
MKHPLLLSLAAAAATLAALTCSAATPAPAAATTLALTTPPKDVAPAPRDAIVDQVIAGQLQRYHYGDRTLNDAESGAIFDQYLQDLDPNKSYFLQPDIDAFSANRVTLDDDIRTGNVQPAFDIFNVYQRRVDQRIQYALKQLDKEPDLTVKESYVFDRSKGPWAKDSTDLDDVWRKRVKNDVIGLLLAGKTWPQVQDTLRKRYQNFAYRSRQITADDVFATFMNSYTHSLDPHTDYFPPAQAQDFQIQMSLKYPGIGASLTTDGEYVKVTQLLPGGPAEQDPLKQLHADDRITGVAQGDADIVDVVGWRLTDVVALIRGPAGSAVRLQLLPAGAAPGTPEKTIKIVRGDVKLEAQAAHQKVLHVTRAKKAYTIGVITIPGFYEDVEARMAGQKDYTSTTHDVRKLLGELQAQHVDGIVVDLRNDGGGSLKEAEDLTGLFIPQGPVVQIRHSDGVVQVDDEDEDSGVVYSGPLTVLVNRFTASAAEIFAAAVQDYHRGAVVGSVTYGKGTVQQLRDLNRFLPGSDDAGQLKLTTDKFYRVSGSSTQNKGVVPDISLPALVDPKDFGESSNPSALPWDEIRASDYSPLKSGLDKALPQLAAAHAARTSADPGWKLFMDGVHELDTERAQTSISLLMADRLKQRTEDDTRRLAALNGWRKLKGLPAAATLEVALKASKPDSADADPDSNGLTPDVLLDESAAIAADMGAQGLFRNPGGSVVADASAAQPKP